MKNKLLNALAEKVKAAGLDNADYNPHNVANPEEQCAFCDKPDVFQKGLCPVCFEDHYGN